MDEEEFDGAGARLLDAVLLQLGVGRRDLMLGEASLRMALAGLAG